MALCSILQWPVFVCGYSDAQLHPGRRSSKVRHALGVPSNKLDSFNILTTERRHCKTAIERASLLVGAATLLGIAWHAVQRERKYPP